MRKLIYAINMTLDGYCDHTAINPDEEVHEYFTQFTREVDTAVFGRKTYELMVPFWPDLLKNPSGQPKAYIDFAQAFDIAKRVVFSRTIDSLEDPKARIAHASLTDEISKLKREPGKNISVGGIDLPTQLAELGLIDEYQFIVYPIVAGKGRHLFDGINLKENLQLKSVESKRFKCGAMLLRYLPVQL